MQRCPFVHATSRIHIEPFFLCDQFVQFCDRRDSSILAFPYSCVQRRPIVRVFQVWLGSVQDQCLSYVLAFLWVLREKIHDKVQGSLSITVSFIHICTFLYQCLDQPDF